MSGALLHFANAFSAVHIYKYHYKGKPLDSDSIFHQKLFRRDVERTLTNSVDIVLAVIGVVVVDHELYIIDIKPPSSDVGGDKDGSAACLELS